MTSALHPFAQIAVVHVLNSLPAGLLIPLFAWTALRILPKQNSRTRFAVWFVALIAVASLPWFPALLESHFFSHALSDSPFSSAGLSAITMPAHWASVLFIAWILVVSILTVRLALGLWRLYQLRQTCEPLDLTSLEAANLDPSLRALIAELNSQKSFFARRVTLAASDHLRVPTAIGLWKPMVVLPSWALRELPASELSIILRHEFAHLRHWDDWTNLLQKLVRVVFFFHPAVWWIEKRLSVEREMACDDIVVAETGNPTGYASCLVSLLERSLAQRGWTMAQAIVHRAREASLRLAQILDPKRPVATRISKPALSLLGAFTVLCLVMAPSTPRVVSFEQTAQPLADQYASAPTQSAPTIDPSLIHNADLHSSSLPAAAIPASVKRGAENHSPLLNSLHMKNSSTTSEIPAGVLVASQSVSDAAVSDHEPFTESSLVAEVSTVLFDESLFADQDIQPDLPTFVVMQATELVVPSARPDGTPHSLVWHVQVWRVTVVNATWKHKAVVPPAHST